VTKNLFLTTSLHPENGNELMRLNCGGPQNLFLVLSALTESGSLSISAWERGRHCDYDPEADSALD
jgi:hypothetical protein